MSQKAEEGMQRGGVGHESGLEALRRSEAFRGPSDPPDDHDHANDHLALLYERSEEQFAAAIPFIRQGLERGERCLYVADDNSRKAVLEAMRAHDIDVDAALESGALSVLTPADTYRRTGEFDRDAMLEFWEESLERAKDEDGYTGLRAAAEMTWALDGDTGSDELVEYEAVLNSLYQDDDYVVMCQYNRERFSPKVIRDIIRTHPHLIHDDVISHNAYYTPPEEFFGPERPANEVDRMVRTLRERTEAKAELEGRQRYLRRQNEITANPDRPFEEKLQALFELGCERFDLDLGAMARVDTEDDWFEVECVSDDHEHFEPGVELPLSETYCTAATETEAAKSVSNPQAEGYDDITVYNEFGVKAYLGTYVEVDGGADRTFFFVSDEARDETFSDDERAFQHLMGQWAKYELEHQRREQDQRTLYEIAADTDRTFEEKLQALFELGCDRFDLELGGMARIDPDTDLFEVESISGDHEQLEPGARVALSETYCRVLATDGETTGITDPVGDGFDGTLAYDEFGVNSYLGTRIGLDDDLDRTLFFISSEPRDAGFSEAERTFHHLMGQWVQYELERQQREAELQRTKEHFEQIFESSHDAIMIVDPAADELIEANPAASEMLGYSRDELLSCDPSDLHPDELDSFRSFVDGVLEEGAGWTDELTCQTKDRGRIPAEISASRIEHDDHPVMLAVVRDISERKERKRELKRKERQFEATFNNPVSFVGLLDPDGAVRRINDNALEFAGIDESEVRGEKFWETPWFAHSEEVQAELQASITRAADGEYVRAELPHQSPDGDTVIMDSMLEPVRGDDGDVVAIVPSGHDITERKEHRRFQRRLYEITADPDRPFDAKLQAVIELGCDRFDMEHGGLARIDPATDLFEVETIRGEHEHLVPGEQYPLSETYCQLVTDDGKTAAVSDPVSKGFEGKLCYKKFGVQAYLGSHLEFDNGVDRTFFFVSDEPRKEAFSEAERTFHHLMGQWVQYELERQHREQALEETVDQLQQSNDRLKQFAYAASHDLQEPLRMVSSYLQLLENEYKDDLDEDAREYIDFAVDGADRMRMMVDDLLAFSRVEQADGEYEQVDCNEIFERVTNDLQARIEEHDAEISVEPLPTVRADSEQLGQLFSNLISNAIKYNDADPPQIEITAKREPDHWEFSVADNGIGIDPNKTDRIFEVFKRLHHEDEYPGTGIGLSLCQEIVENHGGDIWVESEFGEGSTFFFTLPQAVSDS